MNRHMPDALEQGDNLVRRRNLPFLLLQARESAMQYFRPMLRRHGLTDQQWRVIRLLYGSKKAIDTKTIAQSCEILGPSLTGILTRLEEVGLIRRDRSDTDQRRQMVRATPKARILVQRMIPEIEELYRQLEAILGTERLQEIFALLDEIILRLGNGVAQTEDDRN